MGWTGLEIDKEQSDRIKEGLVRVLSLSLLGS